MWSFRIFVLHTNYGEKAKCRNIDTKTPKKRKWKSRNVSGTYKTDHHNKVEMLFKEVLNTNNIR